jgi:hypothetical protein
MQNPIREPGVLRNKPIGGYLKKNRKSIRHFTILALYTENL